MKYRSKLIFSIKLTLSVLLIFIILRRIDIGDTLHLMMSAKMPIISLAILVMVLDRFLMSYRWNMLLQTGGKEIPFGKIVKIYFLGSFVGNFLPSSIAPDAVRVYYANKMHTRISDVVSSVFVDRILGVFSLGMVVLISIAGIFLNDRSFSIKYVWISMALIIMIICTLCLFGFGKIIDKKIEKKWNHFAGNKYFLNYLNNIFNSIRKYKNYPGVLLKVLMVSFGNHTLSIISVYLLALSINLDLSFLYFVLFIPLIAFLIMVPVSIGGIGVQEGAFIYFFQKAGISADQALSLALLFRVTTILVSVPGICFYITGNTDGKRGKQGLIGVQQKSLWGRWKIEEGLRKKGSE